MSTADKLLAFIAGAAIVCCVCAVTGISVLMWRWALTHTPEFKSLESRIAALEAAQEQK